MLKMNYLVKYIVKVALAALFLTNIFGVRVIYGGSAPGHQTSAKITINATVLERTTMTVIKQNPEIVVTTDDIMRGYVDVYAATRLSVRSNNPAGYLLVFEDLSSDSSSIFNSMNVRVGGREVQLSQNRGWVSQPYVRGGVTLDVSYHFLLNRDARPGTYRWPLMIAIHSE